MRRPANLYGWIRCRQIGIRSDDRDVASDRSDRLHMVDGPVTLVDGLYAFALGFGTAYVLGYIFCMLMVYLHEREAKKNGTTPIA